MTEQYGEYDVMRGDVLTQSLKEILLLFFLVLDLLRNF